MCCRQIREAIYHTHTYTYGDRQTQGQQLTISSAHHMSAHEALRVEDRWSSPAFLSHCFITAAVGTAAVGVVSAVFAMAATALPSGASCQGSTRLLPYFAKAEHALTKRRKHKVQLQQQRQRRRRRQQQ